jgi:hypothetical protein
MPAAFDVDAFSTGNDLMPPTEGGVIPPGEWQGAAMLFSLTNTAHGTDADMYSYVFEGSAGIPASEIGVVRTAQPAPVIDLSAKPFDVDGLDLWLAMKYGQPPPIRALIQPDMTHFYFSVSQATIDAGLAPAGWFGGGPSSPATILQLSWSGTAWVGPTVYRPYDQLGLQDADDIDALAISPEGDIWLSLTSSSPTQIDLGVVVNTPAGVVLLPVFDSSGLELGPALGGGGGPTAGIDAISIFDPDGTNASANMAFATRHAFNIGEGAPFAALPPTPAPNYAGVSLTRRYEFDDQLVAQVSGPPAGTPTLWFLEDVTSSTVVLLGSGAWGAGAPTNELAVMFPGSAALLDLPAKVGSASVAGSTMWIPSPMLFHY